MKLGIYFIEKIQHRLYLVGLAGIAGCLVGATLARPQFYVSYLFAYLFWFGIALGCLGILLLHHVTGGAWGALIKPQLEAASQTLPLLALLFIPVLFGLKTLYPWAQPDIVAVDPLLQHKHLYLNIPFFCGRAVVYFLLWTMMAALLKKWSDPQDALGAERSRQLSAPGLILFAGSLTFAVLDWMMSLEPRWYSTIYEALAIIGFMLSALAFVICGIYLLQEHQDHNHPDFKKPYWDLGNMLLAFVMFWAYMSFSQYLIIWSANIPEEIVWYQRRQEGGWFVAAMVLVVFQFVLPFLILLGRRNKQRLDRLARVAALILALSALNLFWYIKPVFSPGHFTLHWLDLATFAAVGGLWLELFLTRLKQRPTTVGTYIPEAVE